MKKFIYLDHNATTGIRPEVLDAMMPYLQGHYGNASSIYQLGQDARKAIDRAREQVAYLIDAESADSVVFTSGGTEAINWAIKGVAFGARAKGRHLVTSKIEHSATLNACKYLDSMGWHTTYLGVDWRGRVEPGHVREAITPETAIVALMHANNEIGTLQPVAEIAEVCVEKGVPFHIDAVQTVGKTPVSVRELGCTLLSLAAHKFYGPKGVGALYIRPGTRLQALLHGGHHERNRRASTENVAGIVGLGAACALASKEMADDEKRVRALRDRLEGGLLEKIECVQVNGDTKHRMFNTTNLSLEGVEGEGLLIGLDLQGVAASSGSACASGQTDVSHVLKAIGLPVELAKASVRLSLGRDNTDEEIDKTLDILPKVVERLRAISPLWGDYKRGLRKSVIGPATH